MKRSLTLENTVLVTSMLQYKKDNTTQRRRVTRQVIDQPIRQNRFSSEPSKSKSVNSPFGTLNDFTEFLMTINSNCRVFENLELGATSQLFFMFGNNTFGRETRQIWKERQKLERTISEGIVNEAKILGDAAIHEAKEFSKQMAEAIQGAAMHETNAKMYRQLMKMYTQEKFLYKRVNALLREENWKDFSNLAPFIFYLTKAFQAKTLAPTPEEVKSWGVYIEE